VIAGQRDLRASSRGELRLQLLRLIVAVGCRAQLRRGVDRHHARGADPGPEGWDLVGIEQPSPGNTKVFVERDAVEALCADVHADKRPGRRARAASP